MKGIILSVILLTICITACKKEPPDIRVIDGNVLEYYHGGVYDGDGNLNGTATLSILDNGRVFVNLHMTDGLNIGVVGPLGFSADGTYAYVVDYEYGHKLEFIIMPSDDIEDEGYFIGFPEHGVSGYMPLIELRIEN
jgi:hypothetical protein